MHQGCPKEQGVHFPFVFLYIPDRIAGNIFRCVIQKSSAFINYTQKSEDQQYPKKNFFKIAHTQILLLLWNQRRQSLKSQQSVQTKRASAPQTAFLPENPS